MSRVLVTGVNGFVGKHLARELSGRGCEVIGVGQDSTPHPLIADRLSGYYSCDLTQPEAVAQLKLSGIDSVISLAGLAKVGDSFMNPEKYMKVNVEVITVLGERLVSEGFSTRVVAISTGAVYDSSQKMPLNENSKLVSSASPYVESKIKMEEGVARLRNKGLHCVVARPFNHTGPEQETGFLLPDLYEKILRAKRSGEKIKVGNLDTKRDYTDVRDVVGAYADLALSTGLSYDTYNICSGRSISGRDILNWLMRAMGASIATEVDEALLRPNDPPEIFGTYEHIHEDVNWSPLIPIKQTIADFVADKSLRESKAA